MKPHFVVPRFIPAADVAPSIDAVPPAAPLTRCKTSGRLLPYRPRRTHAEAARRCAEVIAAFTQEGTPS
jgi:hypothetical protein